MSVPDFSNLFGQMDDRPIAPKQLDPIPSPEVSEVLKFKGPDLKEFYKLEEQVKQLQFDKEQLQLQLRALNDKLGLTNIHPSFGTDINMGDAAYIPVRVIQSDAQICHVETLIGRTKLVIRKDQLAK